jgi:hypothetical protein
MPLLFALFIAGGLYWAANRKATPGRLFIEGTFAGNYVPDDMVATGLKSQGFTEVGPVSRNGDKWGVYASHHLPESIAAKLPLPLTYMGQPALTVTKVEGFPS